MTTTLRFLGGVGTVTGSKFLLRDGRSDVLVDAGMFQGLRALRRRNWDPPDLDPLQLDAVVLTHAHLDHSGYLPVLASLGMTAPVHASSATVALAEIVLRDSATLLDEDARYAAQKGFSKHAQPRPLFTVDDVEQAMSLFEPTEFGVRTPLAIDAAVTLQPAGHILGSASALIEMNGARVLFSGDLGRPSHPLLAPPAAPPEVDTIVVESTYGDRRHPATSDDQLADVISRTVKRGGSVLIPAFAVDRTEVLLMALRRLMAAGRIPQVPVWVDSPMALRALQVYRQALASHAADVRPDVALGADDPFDPGTLREAHDASSSMRLNSPDSPSIVVSASGMATGGRVVHHLKHFLPDKRNSVVLVGYQALGTRGRDLAQGATKVKMHGLYVPVRAEVAQVEGLSVHADADDILTWLGSCPEPPRTVYVVHGEPEAAEALSERIAGDLGWVAVVPRMGEVVRLG